MKPARVAYADPLKAGRHPFQTYMLALTLASGFPLLLGKAPAGTLYAELPPLLEAAWGLMLFGGAAVALLGSYWRGGYSTALTLERAGLSVCGVPALVYGIDLLFAPNFSKMTAALILAGFGLSCLRRSRDIGHVVKRALTPDEQTPIVDKEPGVE